MDAYAMALVAVGLILLGGMVWQLRLSAKTGVVFALAAVGAVLGVSLWAEARRRRLLQEELRREYALSKRELRQAQEAMRKERATYMRRILMLEAEKEKRTAAIERMSAEEVLEAFGRAYGSGPR